MRSPIAVFGLVLITACTASTEQEGASDSDLTGTGAVDGATVDLRFDADAGQTPDAVVRNGNKVSIVLLQERLAKCGDGTSIEVQYRLKSGGPVARKTLGDPRCGRVDGTCPFPFNQISTEIGPVERGDLELWFHATNPSGCEQWDSKNGANYHFNVLRGEKEVLRFPKGAAASQSGPLLADSTVGFDYALDRMHLCDFGGEEGHISFELFYEFDGAHPTKLSSGNIVVGGRLPELVIPHQAHTLTMWFHSPGTGSCAESWDSNFGHNFVFPIKH